MAQQKGKRPTFEEIEKAAADGRLVEISTVDPLSTGYWAYGISATPEPRKLALSQVAFLGKGYLRALAEDALVNLRIVE